MCLSFRRRRRFRGLKKRKKMNPTLQSGNLKGRSHRRGPRLKGWKTQKCALSSSRWLSSRTRWRHSHVQYSQNNNKHVGLYPSIGHSSCLSCFGSYTGVLSANKPSNYRYIIYVLIFGYFALLRREVEGRFNACARLLVLLYGSASQRHLATWHAYYIKFHTLLRHRVHADFHPKTLV